MSARPARRLATFLIPAGLLLTPACSRPSPRTELEIGRHRVSLRAPSDWLYLDHGYEKRFRQDLTYVAVLDLGPVEGEATRVSWPPRASNGLRRNYWVGY